MSRLDYEIDLRQRQAKHLEKVLGMVNDFVWQPCLHDECTHCIGTGMKKNGTMCIHTIECYCPKHKIQIFSKW